MEPWKFRKMRRTKNLKWVMKQVIKTDDEALAKMGAARLSGDQAALTKILREAKWAAGTVAAIHYITDPDLIDEIAADTRRISLERDAAARKSVNQPLLRKLAIYDKSIYKVAVKVLTDEALLAEVAKTAKWEKAGVLAFNKLPNDALRRSVCGEDMKAENRIGAADELGDDKTLMEIFKNSTETQTRKKVLQLLVKSEFPDWTGWLRDTALHDIDIDVRIAAYKHFPEYNKRAVSEFERLSCEDYDRRVAAAEALMDIFEKDAPALRVLGVAAASLIGYPHQSYATDSVDEEIFWNGTYVDVPGIHYDTGIGLEFREYEGFNACD